jgi:hypothetical protein
VGTFLLVFAVVIIKKKEKKKGDMHTWTAGGGCVEGTRIIKTTQNDRNLLNGNNMADSFEK